MGRVQGIFLYNTAPVTSLTSSAWNRKRFYSVGFVAQPELAGLIAALYSPHFPNLQAAVTAGTPRADLEAILLTGIPAGVLPSTDVYAFVSPDRPDTVPLIANYVPLQEPAGGPNFYEFGEEILYEIHIDTQGHAAPLAEAHARLTAAEVAIRRAAWRIDNDQTTSCAASSLT